MGKFYRVTNISPKFPHLSKEIRSYRKATGRCLHGISVKGAL